VVVLRVLRLAPTRKPPRRNSIRNGFRRGGPHIDCLRRPNGLTQSRTGMANRACSDMDARTYVACPPQRTSDFVSRLIPSRGHSDDNIGVPSCLGGCERTGRPGLATVLAAPDVAGSPPGNHL